jgi:hypothetical protein
MKMVKSLLLGSAAGFVAVVGAQAADLPVKARPVQYVKICTLYGDGFYYIPGTDTCIKFSGYIRADYGWNTNANGTDVANSGASGTKDRGSPNFTTRHRARFEVDTRTQTGYGTLRNYEAFQIESATSGQGGSTNGATVTRAFIQWAGFTFVHAQSLSDTWDLDDSWRYIPQENSGSTGANGINQIAYTWEVGNGMALTVGADESLRKSLANLSNPNTLKIGTALQTSFAAEKWPDPFIAYNVNQAWGRFAAAAKAHDVSATYYLPGLASSLPVCSTVLATSGTTGVFATGATNCDHPDDRVGWGAAVGAEFKMDWINPGDKFGASFHYTQGDLAFVFGRMNSPGLFGTGNQVAFGWVTDGVFVNGSDIELTTAWTVQAGYEHMWTPTLKTSFSAAYGEISHNGLANAYYQTQMGCGTPVTSTAVRSATLTASAGNSCDSDFQYFQGGIRTQWNVTKSFFLGVDVAYDKVFTAFEGNGVVGGSAATGNSPLGGSGTTFATTSSFTQSGLRPNGAYAFKDQGEFVATFRAFSAF